MKIPKYVISIESQYFYIYPFQRLERQYRKFKLWLLKRKVTKHFKKLNWTDDKVWGLTAFCSSLDDAIRHLCYELLKDKFNDDNRLYPHARKLIENGFNNNWSSTN